MFEDLLDNLFDRDRRKSHSGGPSKGGIQGMLARLTGEGAHDRDQDDRRYRQDYRPDRRHDDDDDDDDRRDRRDSRHRRSDSDDWD